MTDENMTAAQRILASKQYTEGEPFTAATMNSHCVTLTLGAIASALKNLTDRGELTMVRKKRRGGWINYYQKPHSSRQWLCRAWVSEPTTSDYRPEYC